MKNKIALFTTALLTFCLCAIPCYADVIDPGTEIVRNYGSIIIGAGVAAVAAVSAVVIVVIKKKKGNAKKDD